MENGIPLLSDIGGTEAGLVCSAGCVHRGGPAGHAGSGQSRLIATTASQPLD
jgi:hypothetical protein